MSPEGSPEFGRHDLVVEVRIAGDRKRVWQALTRDLARWWPRSFCAGPATDFVLEQRVGGRFLEVWGKEDGLLWGTVIGLRTHEHIQIAADFAPEFGGPARAIEKFELREDDGKTIVTFSETVWGAPPASCAASLEDGWKLLLGECLAPFIEGRPSAHEPVAPGPRARARQKTKVKAREKARAKR